MDFGSFSNLTRIQWVNIGLEKAVFRHGSPEYFRKAHPLSLKADRGHYSELQNFYSLQCFQMKPERYRLWYSLTKKDIWICVPEGCDCLFCLWTYIPFIK